MNHRILSTPHKSLYAFNIAYAPPAWCVIIEGESTRRSNRTAGVKYNIRQYNAHQ